MQESESRPAARAADAREPTTVERQYDSLQGNAEQLHISDAPLDDRSTVTSAADDLPSDAGTMKDDGTLDTCTLRTEVGLHGRPELEFASEGALDAALARLREEHGDRVTEDDLGQEVMVDAVEAAMIEAGEMNLETVCERLSDATNVDEWMIRDWINGQQQQFPLPKELAAGLMELHPGLVLKFSEFDSDREIVELVSEASGVLNAAEIAWLTSD